MLLPHREAAAGVCDGEIQQLAGVLPPSPAGLGEIQPRNIPAGFFEFFTDLRLQRVLEMNHGVDRAAAVAQQMDELGVREHFAQLIHHQRLHRGVVDPPAVAAAAGEQRIHAQPQGRQQLPTGNLFLLDQAAVAQHLGSLEKRIEIFLAARAAKDLGQHIALPRGPELAVLGQRPRRHGGPGTRGPQNKNRFFAKFHR